MFYIDDNTKAARIFRATYWAAYDAANYERRSGHHIDALSRPNTTETMCTRTFNAIDILIDRATKKNEWEYRHNYIDYNSYMLESDTLDITRNTFRNYRAALNEKF